MKIFALTLTFFLIACTKKSQNIDIKTNKASKTIIIGSSISFGVGASSYENSWPGLLERNNSTDSFINLSRVGYATYNFLPSTISSNPSFIDTGVNITKIVSLKPDVVIISITTNDVFYGFTPKSYLDNLKVITDLLEADSIKYLVTSTTLRADYSYAQSDSAFSVFKLLRQKYSAKGCFVDIMSPISDTINLKIAPEFYHRDLIHPNDLGHSLIYNRLQERYVQLK